MANYKEIDSFSLNTLITEGNLILVDVRTDDEAARGIIHGALHIPLHLLPLRTQELEGDPPDFLLPQRHTLGTGEQLRRYPRAQKRF